MTMAEIILQGSEFAPLKNTVAIVTGKYFV